MKCSVLIDSDLIKKDDIDALNEVNENVCFRITETNNFLPPEVVLMLIEFTENLGFNAAYDILKYVFFKVLSFVGTKKKEDKVNKMKTRYEISFNGKKFSVKAEYPLTEEQMNKLVDKTAEALFSEFGKVKKDE